MARLAALSEKDNMSAGQDFTDPTMAVMRDEEAKVSMEEERDSSRASLNSFLDGIPGDGRSERSSYFHDHEYASSSPPSTTKGHTIITRQHSQVVRQRRSAIKQQFDTLEASNYIVDATIVVENPLGTGGQRFRNVPAEITQYYPGRVKLDTGSEADFVSLAYLLQAGFKMDSLKAIPLAQQTQVEGIHGAKYTPKYEVDLKWSRRGEATTNSGRFLVVDQAPFDVLLSSRRFAAEAARQLVSLPLVRPRKPRGESRAMLLYSSLS